LRIAVNDPHCNFCSSCYTGIYPPEGLQLEVSKRGPFPIVTYAPEADGEHSPGFTHEDTPDDEPAAVEEANRHDA